MVEDLLERARREADAIVGEAQEQARRLLQAAETVRDGTGIKASEVENLSSELQKHLEETIARLTDILNQLRSS